MRRLAMLLLCTGVSVSVASAAAASPEEELLPATPSKKEPSKNAPDKDELSKAAPGKAPLGKAVLDKPVLNKTARRAKAMARPPGRLITKARPAPVIGNGAPSFYVGVHLGGGWGRFNSTTPVQSTNTDGVLGGGQIGINYQMQNLVFGVEADISASAVRGDAAGDLSGTAVTGTVHNDWFATVAGRFGIASGRSLGYLKGGGAWTRYKWDFSAPGGGTASDRETRGGWMAGVGVEQALSGKLSAKIEYNYLNFGTRTETLTTTGGLVATPADIKLDVHLLKVGLNYRFTPF
jgi:outer membrane immunogenic protein